MPFIAVYCKKSAKKQVYVSAKPMVKGCFFDDWDGKTDTEDGKTDDWDTKTDAEDGKTNAEDDPTDAGVKKNAVRVC
jgi:hypothetical protein